MPPSASNPKNPERRRAERSGRVSERMAALYLRAKLYRIVAARFKTPVGEIDLVARRGRVLVFVEVKRRGSPAAEGAALEAVGTARITRAAQWFLMKNPALADCDCRFDVIFLAPGRWPRHLVGAFEAN